MKHSSPCERQAHSWLRSFNPSFASDKASAAIKVTARPFSHVVWAGWGWPGVSALTNCAGQGGTWDLWTGRLSEPCVYGGNFAPKSPASPIVSVLIHSSFILIAPVWPELGMGGQSSMKGFKVLKDGPAHPGTPQQFNPHLAKWPAPLDRLPHLSEPQFPHISSVPDSTSHQAPPSSSRLETHTLPKLPAPWGLFTS